MRDEEKNLCFLEAQEHPERFSDEHLCGILPDGKDLADLKRALATERAATADLDTDAEWKKFSSEHKGKSTGSRWIRIAAMFIGFVFIAGVAFAAMTSLGIIRNPFVKSGTALADTAKVAPKKIAIKSVKVNNDMMAKQPKAEPAKPVTRVFDNVPLAEIMQEIVKYYKVEVVFANKDCKTMRLYFEWDQAKSLDENIAILNSFNQIAITRQGNAITVE